MTKIKTGLYINGKFFSSDVNETFLDQVLFKFLKTKKNLRFAVVVNDAFVQRSDWKKKKVFFNDRIEIVFPFNGG